MSNGYSVIPIDSQFPDKELNDFLNDQLIFVPQNIEYGRFPTLKELRHSIQELGYELEETLDWYVTSKDDFTEIWFRGDQISEDNPREFWFRRGAYIVFDIAQSIANKCGSLVVAPHTGEPTILVVPDSTISKSHETVSGFFKTLTSRLPIMVARLGETSLPNKLFILSQIRQALLTARMTEHYDFITATRDTLAPHVNLLNDENSNVRFLVFDLMTHFREKYYEYAEALRLAIQNEVDPVIKSMMIDSVEKLTKDTSNNPHVDSNTDALLHLFNKLVDKLDETPAVRLAATKLLMQAKPGFLTPLMRLVVTDALINPGHYVLGTESAEFIQDPILKSIENLLLNHRIMILLEVLPQIKIAQDAHDILRTLLDHAFFGAVTLTWMSSLLESHEAERPPVDETLMRENRSRSWLYPAAPTQLLPTELSSEQREILEKVIELDTPWMVHSNLLEKYGLPVTRAALRSWLVEKS